MAVLTRAMAQRDAAVTRQNILDAVGRVLAREGFSGLGINAIAKEAGVGKPLIYRYFGGLPQLLDEFGRDADFWMGITEIYDEMQKETGGKEPDTYAEHIRLCLICYARILRKRPMLVEILASESTAPPELIEPLAEARRQSARDAIIDFLHGTKPPEGVDAEAVYGILLSAFHYLLIRARVTDDFWGVPMKTDEEWKRYEEAMNYIVRKVFEG